MSEEQLQGNVGTTQDVVATELVDTGESDTGSGQEPGTEEGQRELEGSGEEDPVEQEQTRVDEPEQQPPRPEADREACIEQQTDMAPLDSFEKSLLDILDEE